MLGGLSREGDIGGLSGFFMRPSGNIKSYKLETAKWVKAFATTPDVCSGKCVNTYNK